MRLPETLTVAEATATLRELHDAGAQGAGQAVHIVDASALKVFDSAALALLLHARRLAQADGASLCTQGANAQLVQLANLYGVRELLGMPDLA